jgi:hypothetical protein
MPEETTVEYIDVKYAGNSDPSNATAAITFLGDPDRADIPVGSVGQLTGEEVARLSSMGYRLEPVEDLGKLSRTALDERLTSQGLNPKDYANVEEARDALREALGQPDPAALAEELPPAATTGVGGATPPTTSGAGSAAGPGGAGASGDAGGA